MITKDLFKSRFSGVFILVVLGLLILSASIVQAEEMTMSPHKIILNAQGQFEDLQAVIRIPMQPGYTLGDYHVTLKLDGIEIIDAFDLRYCLIDDNFLASFDRNAIQVNPDVIQMAGREVTATVEGWFEGTAAEGSSYRQDFSCSDNVEVISPGRK